MSRILTIDVPDEVYLGLEQLAPTLGVSTEEAAAELLRQYAPRPRAIGAMTEEEAWERMLRYAGDFDSGDPNSADNDKIDRDLIADYSRGL